tara:strand:- start:70 stop:204 length:135 start_codon:yes stop_codon:yes gene_type:complete
MEQLIKLVHEQQGRLLGEKPKCLLKRKEVLVSLEEEEVKHGLNA